MFSNQELDNFQFDEDDIKLQIPSGGLIAGQATSGKSVLSYKIFKYADKIFTPKPKSKLYAYGIYNELVPKIKKLGVLTLPGLPSDEIIDKLEKPALIVLDDLMIEANEKYLNPLYTRSIHHKNLCVFHNVQNIFDKNLVVARKNSQYFFLMRSPTGALDRRNFAAQNFPGQKEYFDEAFNEATKEKFSYLFANFHPKSDPALKLMTNIFPGEDHIAFIPKNG